MATIDVSEANRPIQGGTWGNASSEHFAYKPVANLVIADEVRITTLETGIKLLDATIFAAANLASGTVSLGFRYVDAANSGSDDPTYFISAQSIATAGRFRANANKPPLVLIGAAYLVATFGGAAFPTTNQLDVTVDYDFRGKL